MESGLELDYVGVVLDILEDVTFAEDGVDFVVLDDELFVEYFRAGKFDGFAKCFAEHPQLRPVNLASGERAKARAKAINDGFVANLRDEMRQALREADADTAMPFRPTEADVTTTHFSSPERRRVQAQGSSSHDAYGVRLVAYYMSTMPKILTIAIEWLRVWRSGATRRRGMY